MCSGVEDGVLLKSREERQAASDSTARMTKRYFIMAVCLGGNQIDSRCLLSEEKEGQSVIIGVFYKLVLMEILYLGLTWPLLQFSLASCCISKTHIARYARL